MVDDGGDTFRNAHRGAMAFAEGCYAGIRNPNSHEVDLPELPEHEGLEQLAAFSVIARWVDTAAVAQATWLDAPGWWQGTDLGARRRCLGARGPWERLVCPGRPWPGWCGGGSRAELAQFGDSIPQEAPPSGATVQHRP